MQSPRLLVGSLLVALMLSAVLAVGASATPVAKTVATVECQGASATLLMHPGAGGKAIWDISVESVQNAPSYLIKRLEAAFFVSGELVGTLNNSAGKKNGLGEDEQVTCAFEVHKDGFNVYGTLHLVRLR